jgi:uncharacterized protein (TIGR02118 family)
MEGVASRRSVALSSDRGHTRRSSEGIVIRAFCFLHRRPDLDRAAFRAHWHDTHAALLGDTPEVARHLQLYEQNPRLAGDDAEGFDGVAVLGFGTSDDFRSFAAEPAYRERIRADEERFIDLSRLTLVVTDEPRVIVPPGDERDRAPVKLFSLLRRRPGLTRDEFDRHWAEAHAPIVREALGAHMLGYEQHPRRPGDGPEDYDGVPVVWYASREAFRAGLGGGAYAQKIAPDEERFLDRTALAFVLTGPTHVVWDRA